MENDNDKYSKELNAAVRVVHMACSLCQKVQKQLLSSNSNQIKSKDDDSLVTVADWSVQATVSWMLSEAFGVQNVYIVAEEDAQTLSKPESSAQLEMVVSAVNECLAEAPNFGLKGPNKALGASQVLEAINRCNSTGGPVGRHWVLDPVDGTLGFVRGDQYAIALAMIDNGEVAIGVLGCPNYSVKDDSLVKYSQQHPVMSDMSSGEEGCVMYARKGSGKAWMQPLFHSDKRLELQSSARTIHVSSIDDPALATFCEPVEKANSNHSFTAGIADSVGLSAIWCKLNLAQAAEIEPRELLVQDLMQAVCTRSAELISVLAFWKKRISDDEGHFPFPYGL